MHQPTREQLQRLSGAQVLQAQAHADLAQAQYRYGLAVNELTAAVNEVLYGPLDDGQAQTAVGTVDGEEPPGSRTDSRAAPVRCCPGSSPAAPGTPHP